MSTPFRIQIVNARGDDDQLFVLLEAKSSTGVDGIVPGVSTAFQSLNESKTVTMETVDAGRLYVGYGSFTVPPTPDGDQYYGWIEFSRLTDDSQVWINLSNVDLVGLPLTLQGQAGGKPFSLGYKVAKNGIVDQLKAVAGKVAVVTCRSGQTKILGPTIQPQAYRSFRNYRESLAAGKAAMSITSDPIGQDRKVFTGTMQPDDPIIDLKSEDGISFQVNRSQFSTNLIYRGDGGTLIYNGVTVKQNQDGNTADVLIPNSVYRNILVGMNEGYFTLTGANASADFGGQTPFETGQGNAYARILHETSNSYGFPYADSNLKVLVLADPTAPLILTIIRDDEARDFDDTPTANQPQFGDYQFGIGGGSESLGIITIGGWRYLPNAAGAYGGFLPTVTDWTQMNFSGPGQHIWFKTTGAGAVAADGCFTGAAPAFNNAKTLIWGANVSWVAGHDSPPKPVS